MKYFLIKYLSMSNITLVIPCIFKHFKHIESLLQFYTNQTCLPEEVIISVSESTKVTNEIKNLKDKIKSFPFNLIIIEHHEPKTPGENRQIASEHASKDYIVYQDSDDLPHNQRLEIIKYFFDHRLANHITHLVTSSPRNLVKEPYDPSNIKFIEWNKRSSRKGFGATTMGNISIRKSVLNEIKWSNHKVGEDTRFTDSVLDKYDKCYRVSATLLYYRQHLSSYR